MDNSLRMNYEIKASYPFAMKIAILFGVLLFAGFTLGLIYVAVKITMVNSSNSWLSAICLGPAIFFARLTLIGAKLTPFLNGTFVASEKGIEIIFHHGRSFFFEWEQIGTVKDREIFEVFEVKNHLGTILFSLDYKTPGLMKIRNLVLSKIDSSSSDNSS